jgi:hypothetical protein
MVDKIGTPLSSHKLIYSSSIFVFCHILIHLLYVSEYIQYPVLSIAVFCPPCQIVVPNTRILVANVSAREFSPPFHSLSMSMPSKHGFYFLNSLYFSSNIVSNIFTNKIKIFFKHIYNYLYYLKIIINFIITMCFCPERPSSDDMREIYSLILVIGFIGLLELVTAGSCSSVTDLHTLQVTVLQHI